MSNKGMGVSRRNFLKGAALAGAATAGAAALAGCASGGFEQRFRRLDAGFVGLRDRRSGHRLRRRGHVGFADRCRRVPAEGSRS